MPCVAWITASIAESLSRAKVFVEDTGEGLIETLEIQKNGYQKVKNTIYDTPGAYSQSSLSFLRDAAVRYGRVEILQLAVANGCAWNVWTCSWAARHGHLEVLQWLRENGCPWHEWTCLEAAFHGHLEVLQWAREKGCPWHEDTCSCAAGNGRLEVLPWAIENGCPWDEETCSCAAANGRLEVLN